MHRSPAQWKEPRTLRSGEARAAAPASGGRAGQHDLLIWGGGCVVCGHLSLQSGYHGFVSPAGHRAFCGWENVAQLWLPGKELAKDTGSGAAWQGF